MSNPLYNMFSSQQPNIMAAVQSLKQNPLQFILQRKFNVPQNLTSDPNAMIQYLMNTGQVSQQRYNEVMQSMGKYK